ncbi:disease resistance protein RGA2-like [Prunus yedoensis var. nudiflora]|uniref:Disease resistance protein RGA2-like n=1 Tax=Prunus yedoensis var. nudiflora TaxID=2094558 RepID=A0A314XT77_PRUYE|nr:disease resistance protein RGA2-like [Prunus yedoensis var. nudiflora]
MVALPEWFQGAANTLQVLVIEKCENLEALPGWLTSFTSLRKLVLDSCKKSLSLPEGIHSLTTLELKIINCLKSASERRCERHIGEDLPMSYVVPPPYINYMNYPPPTTSSLTTSLLGCARKDSPYNYLFSDENTSVCCIQ